MSFTHSLRIAALRCCHVPSQTRFHNNFPKVLSCPFTNTALSPSLSLFLHSSLAEAETPHWSSILRFYMGYVQEYQACLIPSASELKGEACEVYYTLLTQPILLAPRRVQKPGTDWLHPSLASTQSG